MGLIYMAIHLGDDCLIYAFDATARPAATIQPGTTVTFDTLDTSSGVIKSREDVTRYMEIRDPKRVNPATGPVWVEGAEPGDTISVTIEDIILKSPGHVRTFRPQDAMGVLVNRFPDIHITMASVEDQRVTLDFGITIPARPMVGVIGVAPAGEAITTIHPGDHGGNMDIKEIRIGSTVHLPVLVPGGLVSLGDIHANMGDGEVTGTGIEICANVRTRIALIKGKSRPRPWIELPETWISYGHGATLEEAVEQATSDMADILQDFLGITGPEAYMLISACADVGIGQSCAGSIHRTAKVMMQKL
jgi:amidase